MGNHEGRASGVYALGPSGRVSIADAMASYRGLILESVANLRAELDALERRVVASERTPSTCFFVDAIDRACVELVRRADHYQAMAMVDVASEVA